MAFNSDGVARECRNLARVAMSRVPAVLVPGNPLSIVATESWHGHRGAHGLALQARILAAVVADSAPGGGISVAEGGMVVAMQAANWAAAGVQFRVLAARAAEIAVREIEADHGHAGGHASALPAAVSAAVVADAAIAFQVAAFVVAITLATRNPGDAAAAAGVILASTAVLAVSGWENRHGHAGHVTDLSFGVGNGISNDPSYIDRIQLLEVEMT